MTEAIAAEFPAPSADEQMPTIQPFVAIGPGSEPLAMAAQNELVRVVVDNKLNLPGMVELTFRDLDGTVLSQAGIAMGTQVSVSGTSVGGVNANLIVAEVTAIEGWMYGMTSFTTVRGYTLLHRLQRARHSKTFLNTTDADLARQIATQAGLTCGSIVEAGTTHAYLAQVNQTDAEFLTERALEIGYELGMSGAQFFFRPAATLAAPAVTGLPPELFFRRNLTSFRARVSAGNLTPDVEVRVWDPMQVAAFAAPATTPAGGPMSANALGTEFEEGKTGSASGTLGNAEYRAGQVIDDASQGLNAAGTITSDVGSLGGLLGDSGGSSSNSLGGGSGSSSSSTGKLGSLGGLLGGAGNGASALGSPLGVNNLGPVPSPTAHIVVDRPLADATSVHTGGTAGANALAGALGVTAAEAEGDTVGDPTIQPGSVVNVTNVQATLGGNWLISHVRHIFDDREYGYHTNFSAHGREDRSMLGLSMRALADRRPKIEGVVCGVVSNVLDPVGRARVKVVLPWLAPDFETDWAPVGQFNAGPKTGALFVPEVGNEVLLVFEFGDPRRPYVVGSLVNAQTSWNLNSGAGPMAALSALAGGLGGIGGQIAGLATDVEGIAATVAALTPAGQAMQATGMGGASFSGGAISGNFSMSTSQVEGAAIDLSGAGLMANAEGVPGLPSPTQSSGTSGQAGGMSGGAGLGAVQQSPGMVGEVIRSGLVTSTGNALIFNDQPMPGMATAAGGLGSSGGTASGAEGELGTVGEDMAGASGGMGGMSGGMGGGMGGGLLGGGAGGAAGGAAAGPPPLASSISLGTQAGNHGIYIDQVSAMVLMQANATPGVSTSETPMLVITTGPTGNVIINGGESLTLASDTAITMIAPEIMIGGETITVAGELIPLTPG